MPFYFLVTRQQSYYSPIAFSFSWIVALIIHNKFAFFKFLNSAAYSLRSKFYQMKLIN